VPNDGFATALVKGGDILSQGIPESFIIAGLELDSPKSSPYPP